MTKQEKKILNEEQVAMDNYAAERRKMSDDLYQVINTQNRHTNLAQGLIGGLLVGLLCSFVSHSVAKTPCAAMYDVNYQTVTYNNKPQPHKPYSTLTMMVVAILVGLAYTYTKNQISNPRNHHLANQLASDAFKNYFEKTFAGYNNKHMPFRTMHAAALVINNIPQEKLEYLRALARSGITYDNDGNFIIEQPNINAASKIITTYIRKNPELEKNILRIMNDEKITTYIINGIKQNTK